MADVVIKITGDNKEYKQSLGEVKSETSGLASLFGPVAAAAAVAFAAVAAAAYKSVEAFREQEKATEALNQAMVQSGTFSSALRDKYLEQATALQKVTTFGDENIIQAQATLQSLIGQREVSEKLTKATLDLAAAKGIDLRTAAEMMGKSIGTSTNALARQGIEIDSSLTKQEKLAQVIDKVNQKYGGQAEAQAQGLGSLAQLQNSISDLAEVFGEILAPYVGLAAQALTNMFDAVSSKKEVIGLFFNMMRDNVIDVVFAFTRLGDIAGAVVGTIAGSMALLIEGKFKAAAMSASQMMENINEAIAKNQRDAEAKQAEWDAADENRIRAKHEREANLEKTAKDNARILKEEEFLTDQIAQEERDNAAYAAETARLTAHQDNKLRAEIQHKEFLIANEKDKRKKLELIKEKQDLQEQEREDLMAKKKIAARDSMLNTMIQFQQSESQTLKSLGKAAATASIIINTAAGASAAVSQAMIYFGPLAGPPIGYALAAAIVAFGAEQIGKINAAADGGLITGPGGPTSDLIPAMLSNGELVVPARNFDEVVDATAASRSGEGTGGGGVATVVLELKDGLMDFIEAKTVERNRLNISFQGA